MPTPFYTNLTQFTINIVKVNFIITYLTEVTQSCFEIRLDQDRFLNLPGLALELDIVYIKKTTLILWIIQSY